MPQDIRVSPDGKIFYVADMMADGVHRGRRRRVHGRSASSRPASARTASIRAATARKLYVANRGSHKIHGQPSGKGSVSVIDFATRKVVATWPIPGGGSPDMGNVSADGKTLWLSGRYDNVVYAIDTDHRRGRPIPVGQEPHGLTVWPQTGPLLARPHRQHALGLLSGSVLCRERGGSEAGARNRHQAAGRFGPAVAGLHLARGAR